MSRTLILLFHPNFGQSRANRALCAAASTRRDVEIVDMQARYPDGAFDVEREVDRLLSADRLVLQFPVQWYSTPPLLKAWQDSVLTRMFYIAYETEGRLLQGKPLLVAATAGNVPEAYAKNGANLYPLAELLLPLQSTAHRCGLRWTDPFLFYQARHADEEFLAQIGERYLKRIETWIAESEPVGALA